VIALEYLALANERMLRRVTVTCRSRKDRVPGLPLLSVSASPVSEPTEKNARTLLVTDSLCIGPAMRISL
jgi:hypothetical protein